MTQRERGHLVTALLVGIGVSAALLSATTVMGVPTDVGSRVHQDEAQQEIENGQLALRESRWADAEAHFRKALDLSPGNGAALAGLEQAQDMQDEGALIDRVGTEDVVRQQEARQEFDAAIQNASQLLEQKQFGGARQTVIAAQVQLSARRNLLPDAEVRQRDQDAADLLDEIDAAQEVWELEQDRIEREELVRQKLDEQREEELKRMEQIYQNLVRVREFQLQGNYDEALQIIDQILFLDDGNPIALTLRDAIQTAQLWHNNRSGP